MLQTICAAKCGEADAITAISRRCFGMSDVWDNEEIGNDDEMFNGTGDDSCDSGAVVSGGGSGKPPSEKQIQFAERISKATGVPLPDGFRDNWRIVSAYIEQNKAKFERAVKENPLLGGGPSTPPSEKQIGFARKIADTLGKTLPEGCDRDWRLTRKFIDDNMPAFEAASPAGGGAPSEKQVSLARLISEKGGVPLPEGYDTDWRIVKKFIDENKGRLDQAQGPRGRKKSK